MLNVYSSYSILQIYTNNSKIFNTSNFLSSSDRSGWIPIPILGLILVFVTLLFPRCGLPINKDTSYIIL
jgi:hypothetical protein